MADSMYRDRATYCARCCTNLIAEERTERGAVGGPPAVSVIVVRCPHCEHVVVTHPSRAAVEGYLSPADIKRLDVLLERGRARQRQP